MKNKYAAYLENALKRLEKWLPKPTDEMLQSYLEGSAYDDWSIEEDMNGFVYCLFLWQETDSQRIVLLVYDEKMRIIGDLSAVSCSVDSLLYSEKLYDDLSEESDWMYLEHYTLCAAMFDELPYPPCQLKYRVKYKGQALLYSNAYVTRAFRKRGIFTFMIHMTGEFALRNESGNALLYSVISLDPDVAVYGPDAVEEPYHYSFEKDEPVRMQNCEIMKKLGFEPVRLEETEPDENADGTKLWFALRRENDMIIDVEESISA